MARQVITKLIDDLDGGEADETLAFALDGNGYEIDLSSKNAKKIRDFLETYIEAGTRTGRVGSGAQLQKNRPQPVAQNRQNRDFNQTVRAWAVDNGYDITERGRIPQYILDAFETKTPNPARTRTVEPALIDEDEVKPAKKTAAKKVAPAKKVNGSTVVSFKPERQKVS